MTKEITKAFILQQMENKFGLREFAAAKFLFDETVIPTYDISEHLEIRTIEQQNVSITAATAFLFFTVSADERWSFSNYNLSFYSEGAYKVSGLSIKRTLSGIGAVIYLDLTKGQTTSYSVSLGTPVMLDPGDEIRVLIDTYVSTADLRLSIDVQKSILR